MALKTMECSAVGRAWPGNRENSRETLLRIKYSNTVHMVNKYIGTRARLGSNPGSIT
jgi:LDH2 family malate/lactate/ureidoglycolate dehydrogenase